MNNTTTVSPHAAPSEHASADTRSSSACRVKGTSRVYCVFHVKLISAYQRDTDVMAVNATTIMKFQNWPPHQHSANPCPTSPYPIPSPFPHGCWRSFLLLATPHLNTSTTNALPPSPSSRRRWLELNPFSRGTRQIELVCLYEQRSRCFNIP